MMRGVSICKDTTVIIGDWNAKIGEDAYEDWAGTVGKFGCGNTTDDGTTPRMCVQ